MPCLRIPAHGRQAIWLFSTMTAVCLIVVLSPWLQTLIWVTLLNCGLTLRTWLLKLLHASPVIVLLPGGELDRLEVEALTRKASLHLSLARLARTAGLRTSIRTRLLSWAEQLEQAQGGQGVVPG